MLPHNHPRYNLNSLAPAPKNPAENQPLGIITKLQVTPENKGIQRSKVFSSAVYRAEKFMLQDLSCNCLNDVETIIRPDGTTVFKNEWRVNYCLKRRIDASEQIGVFYNEERQKAQYSNLQRCGSIWTCPVCASQISEGRRLEVKQAINSHLKSNGFVYMLTFTNRHHMGDDLDALLIGQQKSLKRLWEKTKVKKQVKEWGYIGRITATEVTYGGNGWHPHKHMIFFFDKSVDMAELQNFFAVEWQVACEKSGMKVPDLEHGVNVQDAKYASDYMSKFGADKEVLSQDSIYANTAEKEVTKFWGLDSEITKGHIKKGKKGSMTPWDILRLSAEDEKYRQLFRNYAYAFKGNSQIMWSRGLKDHFEIGVQTDDDIVNDTDKEAVLINYIASEIWQLLLRYKKRSDYLKAIENDMIHGGSHVEDLVLSLARRYAETEKDELLKNSEIHTLTNYIVSNKKE